MRQVAQETPDTEIIGVVDRGFGAQSVPGSLLFVVLFEVRVFIIDVQGGIDSLGNNARPESAAGGGFLLELAPEDQLHLFWSAQIDVLADDFLEEVTPVKRFLPDLREGELRL